MSDQSQQDEQEPQEQGEPDGDAQNPVEAMDPEEQRESAWAGGEQNVNPASGRGFNPDAPVATSAPPPEWQSGEPELGDEGQQVQARPHAEESITDPGTPQPDEEGDVESRKAEREQS